MFPNISLGREKKRGRSSRSLCQVWSGVIHNSAGYNKKPVYIDMHGIALNKIIVLHTVLLLCAAIYLWMYGYVFIKPSCFERINEKHSTSYESSVFGIGVSET